MELDEHERERSETYLNAFDTLMGDKRTQRTFQNMIHGSIAGESLRAAVIARFSPRDGSHPQRRTTGETHG